MVHIFFGEMIPILAFAMVFGIPALFFYAHSNREEYRFNKGDPDAKKAYVIANAVENIYLLTWFLLIGITVIYYLFFGEWPFKN